MTQLYQKNNIRIIFFRVFYFLFLFFFGSVIYAQTLPSGIGGISTDLFPSGVNTPSVSGLGSTPSNPSESLGTTPQDPQAPQTNINPSIPITTFAELPYGGIRIVTIACTCHSSPSKALVTLFDFVQFRYLRLAYMPKASILFMYYDIWSSQYMLGSYNPYVRNTCLITVEGGDCEPLPDDGLLGGLPGSGTSQ